MSEPPGCPAAYGIVERDGAVFIDVHAVPGSRNKGVVGVHGDALKVAVHARAREGKANAALVEALARVAGVRRSAVDVVSGHASRRKRVRIEGVTAAEVRARVKAALGGAPDRAPGGVRDEGT